MRKLIAGNWKMNGLKADYQTFEAIVGGVEGGADAAKALICSPSTMIMGLSSVSVHNGGIVSVGGQDCHAQPSGAHTGDISAEMLADAGAEYVILGHSERRADHGETDAVIAAKVDAALRAKLVPIVCVGEQLADRQAVRTMDVVLGQLSASLPDSLAGRAFVVAYEPVWAIGSGLTASTEQIGEVHLAIREALEQRFGKKGAETQILYGGSMKPGNADEILGVENVNGGLIGGASLNEEDFLSIYRSAL